MYEYQIFIWKWNSRSCTPSKIFCCYCCCCCYWLLLSLSFLLLNWSRRSKSTSLISMFVCKFNSQWQKEGEWERKMECTRQRLVYRNICSPNEITWRFHKRHWSLFANNYYSNNRQILNVPEQRKKYAHEINKCCSWRSDGIHCCLHTFSLPEVCFYFCVSPAFETHLSRMAQGKYRFFPIEFLRFFQFSYAANYM